MKHVTLLDRIIGLFTFVGALLFLSYAMSALTAREGLIFIVVVLSAVAGWAGIWVATRPVGGTNND